MSYSGYVFVPQDGESGNRIKLDNIVVRRPNKTIYRDGDKSIKVFDKNYPKTNILNEALNQARVEDTPLNTPRLLEVLKLDGRWAIVSEYISGKTLADLMRDNHDKYDEYLRIFVELQLLVQTQRVDDLPSMKEKIRRRIPRSDIPEERRAELAKRLEEMPFANTICHGDFYPTNIVIAAYGTPYIIDWSHVTQGDTSADVARTFLLFITHGEEDHGMQYLELYCKLSGADVNYIKRMIPLIAAAHSVKALPEEKETLRKWAKKDFN